VGSDLQRGSILLMFESHQQVEAAILAVIGQRLVAHIDDRGLNAPLINVIYDVIGALRNLEVDRLIVSAMIEFEGKRIACPTRPAPEKTGAWPGTTTMPKILAA